MDTRKLDCDAGDGRSDSRRFKDLAIFWAKSKNDGQDSLSVLQHAIDTSGTIDYVTQTMLARSTRERLQHSLESVPLDHVLRFAAWAHDVGKISAYFSPKVPNLHNRVNARGFTATAVTPAMLSANPHSIVGAKTVRSWMLSQPQPNRRSARGWMSVIGGHHGMFPPPSLPRNEGIEHENWGAARIEFLEQGLRFLGLTEEDSHQLANVNWSAPGLVLVTGLLIAADWLASNERYFPYDVEGLPDDGNPSPPRLSRAIETMSFGGVWVPSSTLSAADFSTRFDLPKDAQPRRIQLAGLEAAQMQEVPALYLVESETGSGKTEAALAMAEATAAKLGLNGVFIAQPTRVTSDAMFDRVETWLRGGAASDESISLILSHGKSELNETYQALYDAPSRVYDSDDRQGLSIEAHSWFRGKKTGLLAPVVVGTIDQLLFAALKSKHLVLRHLGLAGKVVIIDEVHAADAFMRVYLTRVLEWLGTYGVPVIALSATQPPEIRAELIGAYQRGALGRELTNSQGDTAGPEAYPRITVADSAGVRVHQPGHEDRIRRIEVEFFEGDERAIAEAVLEAAATGGCVAVICNTVSRAQSIYREVVRETRDVTLLHSRFLTSERRVRESNLVSRLGRDAGRRPRRHIVISTQIIEQGLDLDFDVMFSDIAPLDLIIQRAGRLHRHSSLNNSRPADKIEARLVITGSTVPDTAKAPPEFPRGIVAVYRRAPLLRSAYVLARHLKTSGGTITIPHDVAPLVYRAYHSELQSPAAWATKWEEAETAEELFRSRQQEKAKHFCISSPYVEDTLESWTGALSIADEVHGVAQVRDADESFEVIVVQRRDGRLYPLQGQNLDDVPVDGTVGIDWSIARSLARCTVRLPGWSLTDSDLRALEADGQESWQTSPWLAGQLPLVLDEDLVRELDSVRLVYDIELGLLVDRIPQERSRCESDAN